MAQQISPDIPAEKAWRQGRRVYVRAGYKTQLDDQIRRIGGKWDAEEKALWVGSGKLEQVIPMILAQAERAAQVQAVKDAGRWVAIPYEATAIRAEAKKLGAKWDAQRKEWAMPTDEALAAVTRMIGEQKAARQQQRQQASAKAAVSEDDIIAASGRTLTGERHDLEGKLSGRGKRSWAEEAKPQPGTVRRLADGKRVLVLSSAVDFLGENDIADQAPHLEPGWYYRYTGAVVEPTADERSADEAREAQKRDGEEIAAAVKDAKGRMEWVPEAQAWDAPVPETAGEIAVTTGTAPDGTLYLLADGRAMWRHPGYYDDYRRSEGITSDPEIAVRVRAVLAAGSRKRAHEGRGYTVTEG